MTIYGDKWVRVLGNMAPIHPNTVFGEGVRLGENVVIEENVKIGDRVFIGHHAVIRDNTVIGSDTKISHYFSTETGAKIGNHCSLGIWSHLTRDVVMEDWVFYGPHTVTLNTKRMMYGRREKSKLEPPIIRFGARIGGFVVLMPGVEIGREAFIGTRSLVTKDVPAGEMWFGTPAKFVGMVPEEEYIGS